VIRPLLYAVLTALCWLGTASASSEELLGTLQGALAAIDRAAAAPEPERESILAPAIAALDAAPSLGPARWLVEPLQARPPDLVRGRARIAAALDALAAPAAPQDSAAARLTLVEILNGSPFVTRDLKDSAPAWAIAILALLDWTLTHIANIVRWPFDRLGDGPAFLPFVTLLALFGLISLVTLYRRGLHAALVVTAAVPDAALELPPTSAEAADRAQRLAARGQFRDACHFLFMSALLWIEEHGDARFDRAATNREHLALLEHATLARPFRPLVERFDRLWYGQVETSPSDYRDIEVLVTRLKQTVT
jgi:hypothetical protein